MRAARIVLVAVLLAGAGAAGGIWLAARPGGLPWKSAPVPSALPPRAISATGADDATLATSRLFVDLAKRVVPSVVNISTLSSREDEGEGAYDNPEDLFRRFFEEFMRRQGRGGSAPEGGDPRPLSLGTGFIVSIPGEASNLIFTNNHVVAGADEIKITFTEDPDENPVDGEVVGRAVDLDVALIRVKTKRALVPLAFGDSDALEVGEYVAAVGNPFGQGHSITHGIISAKGRLSPDFPFTSYLQTDAPINPGNSGGPLVNARGEVIGINNAIDQRAQGIGFAIPANSIQKILPQLRQKGTVTRGYIGVLVNELTPEIAAQLGVGRDARSPVVTHVFPGEPADRAGLKPYDLIVELGGKKIRSSADLISQVIALEVGKNAPLKILRAGKPQTLDVRVAERKLSSREADPATRSAARNDYGMMLDEAPGNASGVIVSQVYYGGAADEAGILRGDWILEVDRKPVHSIEDFKAIVREARPYLVRLRRTEVEGPDGNAFSIVLLDLRRGASRR